MKIVIVGAGFTGVELAKRLIADNYEVTIIDSDESVTSHISGTLDCATISSSGNDIETLKAAGLAKATALICLTSNDEVNMITCSLADSLWPDVLKIARVRNYAYYTNTRDADGQKLYGIDYMIHPDVEAAASIVNAVNNRAVGNIIDFDDSVMQVSKVPVMTGSSIAGVRLMDIRALCDFPMLVVYIEENGKTFLPSGTTTINAPCFIGVITAKKDLEKITALCGNKLKPFRKIAIIGAGHIGLLVLKSLLGGVGDTKAQDDSFFGKLKNTRRLHDRPKIAIIDSKPLKAQKAQDDNPEVLSFCGDATDEAFLNEEGIPSYDLAICATHNHYLNMVLAAFLESLGVGQSIALVTSSSFTTIATKLGVDVSVSLRDVVVDCILSRLRGGAVKEVHTITDELEIIECIAPVGSRASGVAVKDLSEHGKYLILLVKHADNDYTIANGATVINDNDHLVLITQTQYTKQVLKLFSE